MSRRRTPKDAPANRSWAVSRRDFIKLGGAGAATLVAGCASDELLPEEIASALNPDLATTLTRPQDLVFLRFEFANLTLQPLRGGARQLVAKAPLGYIVVHFQPQTFLEQAVLEGASATKPVDARLGGPSRVVLKVPTTADPIPYTGEGLLKALGSLQMSVAPHAVPPAPPPPVITFPPIGTIGQLTLKQNGLTLAAAPDIDIDKAAAVRTSTLTRSQLVAQKRVAIANGIDITASPAAGVVIGPITDPNVRPRSPNDGETSLELPFRLLLSPNIYGGWAHATSAAAALKNGRHELWHTRLGVRNSSTGTVSEAPSYLRAVRAVWTRDPSFVANIDPAAPPVFANNHFTPASLVAQDRGEIVHLSSNFLDLGSYKPRPVDVNNLMLSTLGGWLDSNADFGLSSPLNLVSWRHQAAMGRDYFVKTVRKGRLYPWGHFALKITITERKFRGPDRTTAYLYQRTFIQVLEPMREYGDSWRKMPFKSVLVKTLVTPNLSDLVANPALASPIKVDGTPFRFKMEGVDRANNVVQFAAVATWAPVNGTAVNAASLRLAGGAAAIYDAYPIATRRSSLDGQRIAYSAQNKTDDTTYETSELLFDGAVTGEQPSGVPFPAASGIPYLPGMSESTMAVEAIRHLVGDAQTTPFQYHLKYLQSGFSSANKGELLFQVKEGLPAVGLNFTKKSDRSGGFVAPSLDIIGISRKTGPISGDASSPAALAASFNDVAANTFDPKKFLKSLDAQLFGVVPLADIIESVADAAGGLDKAPNFITQAADAVTGFLEDIVRLDELLAEAEAKTGAALTTLRSKIDAVLSAVNGLFSAPDLDGAIAAAVTLIDELDSLLASFLSGIDSLPAGLLVAAREDLKRRVKSIRDTLSAVKTGLKAFATGLEMAKNLTVRLEWKAPLQPDPLGFFVPDPAKGGLILAVEARGKQVGDKPAGVDIVAGIENFDVNVFGKDAKIVSIPFERIVFKVESNRKPDVDVVFKGGVGFDGVLAFIETLSKLIPSQGFSDPPALTVDEEGIRSSFSIPIPSIAVGVFSMQNMRLSAGFEVPFIGNPLSVSFGFCTREEPFIITVMMIGGGGYVGLKLTPKGMMLLEMALEARAQLAVDFGVASGSISIAAGVSLRLQEEGGKQTGELTGYFRFQGKVDVLGIISASITLLLELTYEFASGKLVGRATLTIEISIFFFSITVEVSCERKLAGSNDDPTFVEQMSPYLLDGEPVDPWAEYMGAFLMAA